MNNIGLDIPGTNNKLFPGCRVKLGRFEITTWEVNYGWFSWGYNRPICGWFLTDISNTSIVKPLHLSDFDDIIFIER